MIHPTAQIDPTARIADNVSVGAFSVIGADVVIGEGTTVGPHVVIEGPTIIGRDNRISQFASIGGPPQDKKWQGERTEVIIGDRNLIREFVTINRGTGDGGGITRIGNDNWLLAYVHIAHDCQVGNHVVFSNYSALAGHGMGCLVGSDVPPFVMMANETRGRPRGINSEGLKRRGFDTARIAAIKRAYRTLYMGGLPLAEAREQLLAQAETSEDVRQMLEFLDRSERSLAR
jgi:UDP-N-acetylglucosamine acyltransferase